MKCFKLEKISVKEASAKSEAKVPRKDVPHKMAKLGFN